MDLSDDDVLLSEEYKKKDDILDDDDLDENALLYGSDEDDEGLLELSPAESKYEFSSFAVHDKYDTSLDSLATSEEQAIDANHGEELQNQQPHLLSSGGVEREINTDAEYAQEEKDADSDIKHFEEQNLIVSDEDVQNGELAAKRIRLSSDATQHDDDNNVNADEELLSEQHGEDETGLERVRDEEESDDDDSDRRGRFRSERTTSQTTKSVRVTDGAKREIPDTLEISEEAQQQIENFDKQQREKRNNRTNWNRNRGKGRNRDFRRGLPANRGAQRFSRLPNQFQRMLRPNFALTRPLFPVSQANQIARPPPIRHLLPPQLLGQHMIPPNLRSMPPPPLDGFGILGPPPAILPRQLLGPPPVSMPVQSTAAPFMAPPAPEAIASSIPVISTTNRDPAPELPKTAAVTVEETKGNPIPTLMSSTTWSNAPTSGQAISTDDKLSREVVFSDKASRDPSKLSVKITRSPSRSRSRSRSRSASPRPSHKRTVIRLRRSRSPRSRSRRRSKRSPSSRKRSRRISRSMSPKRRSPSPPTFTAVAQPAAKKPTKIHINPHFKGPRTFPAPATAPSSNAVAMSAAVQSSAVSSAMATAKASPALPPGIAGLPPPHLLIPPPPLPNPAVKPPALPQSIAVPPPRPAVPSSVFGASQSITSISQAPVESRPNIAVPPPNMLPPPGFGPPPFRPHTSSTIRLVASTLRPPVLNMPPPKLPINLSSVPQPAITITSQAEPQPHLRPSPIMHPSVVNQPPPQLAPRAPAFQAGPRQQSSHPTSILGAPPSAQVQRRGARNPVAHIRPVLAGSIQGQRVSVSIKDRLAPRVQSRNTQQTNINNAKKPAILSRLKPPPSSVRDQALTTPQVWDASNEADAKYKALLAQQAEQRRQIFAKKSRRKRPAQGLSYQSSQPQKPSTLAGALSSIQAARPTAVNVKNLASATKLHCVERLLNSIAPVTNVKHDLTSNTVSATFQSRNLAEKFAEKYNRYMLNLSYISVTVED